MENNIAHAAIKLGNPPKQAGGQGVDPPGAFRIFVLKILPLILMYQKEQTPQWLCLSREIPSKSHINIRNTEP